MSGNINVRNLTGGQGGVVLRGTQTETGDFQAIQAIEASTLGACTTNLDQTTASLTNQAVPAGLTIFGSFSEVSITSGTVIAYTR